MADPGKHIHRHRPPRYSPAVQQALIAIWAASTFRGPVRLAGGMALLVENLVTHGHLPLDEETRDLLLQMSPTTIGRLLAGERKRYLLHGISHARSTPLGGRIPIQTCMDPPLDVPGALAVDLVGHDGGQAVGDFNWTLTGAGGASICAAAVPSDEPIDTLIDQTPYWLTVDSYTAACYFVGMLGSTAVQSRVSEFQPQGQFGRRHVHSVLFEVVPTFDPQNRLHLGVAGAVPNVLSVVRGYLNADPRLADPNRSLTWRRRQIRTKLAIDPNTVRLEQTALRVLDA